MKEAVSSESLWIEGPVKLHARHWAATDRNSAKGTLLIVHGYSEHGECYTHVAEFFHRAGYEAFALDLPGHGRSQGRRSDIRRFSDYVHSMEAFVEQALKLNCPKPISILGHSLGGLVVLRFIETSYLAGKIERLCISSPLLGLFRFSVPTLPWLKRFTYLLPNVTLNNEAELGEDVLTHDKKMSERRRNDPLIKSRVTPRWTREVIKARELAFEDIDHIRIPMALFQAGDERVVSRSEAERFFDLFKGPKEIHVYEGFFHEILNEIGREKVMQDMLAWVQKA